MLNKPTVSSVPPKYLDQLWGNIRPLLLKGEKYWNRFYSLDDLYTSIKSGKMQLWVNVEHNDVNCVLITTMEQYPKGLFLRYLYIGGSGLRAAGKYVYIIENWAKDRGAIGFEVLGRPGWERMLRRSPTIGSFDKIAQHGSWFVGEF